MPGANRRNTIGVNHSAQYRNSSYRYTNNHANKNNNYKNHSYIEGLMKCSAFKCKLSDYAVWMKVFILLFRLFTVIFYSLWFALKSIAYVIVALSRKNKFFKITFIILAILLIVAFIDFLLFNGKIYPGVRVGDLDLSNKNIEEAKIMINDKYAPRLYGGSVTVYVSEDAKNTYDSNNEDSGIAEQLSVEDAKHTIKYWKIQASELEAELPVTDIVNNAYYGTRGITNIFNRIGAALFGKDIKPYAVYDSDALNTDIEKINKTIGHKVVNPTVVFDNGFAIAQDGEDGNMVDEQEFEKQLNDAFLQKDAENSNFVVNLYHRNQKISKKTADNMADLLNDKLKCSVSFNYKGENWSTNRNSLCNWIDIDLIEDNNESNSSGCSCTQNNSTTGLQASINNETAISELMSHFKSKTYVNDDFNVKFTKNDSGVIDVKTSGSAEMPYVSEAINSLEEQWLDNLKIYENNKNTNNNDNKQELSIDISSKNVPDHLDFNQALVLGVISEISSYSTSYTTGSGTANRNHNIALVSSMLDNTICESNGGKWSFIEYSGEITESQGFKEASTVVGNSYEKGIGGGVCQVATTIFNSVYDAGCNIVSRSSHNLYIASYPAGRDAAINYPSPDLIWKNDLNSDILLKVSTNGYKVTCSLYGLNPHYKVVSEAGNWEQGDKYKTEYIVDPTKPANSKYTQSSGADGRSITVIRKIYNKDGVLISQQSFSSKYAPKNEIIVLGPGDEANSMLNNKTARMKTDKDNW